MAGSEPIHDGLRVLARSKEGAERATLSWRHDGRIEVREVDDRVRRDQSIECREYSPRNVDCTVGGQCRDERSGRIAN